MLELAGSGEAGSARSAAAGSAEIAVHGWGGQLPNMDLFYLVKRNLDLHTGLPTALRASEAPLPPAVRSVIAAGADLAAAFGPAAAAAARSHAAELRTLAAFAGQLASGRPTGAHAPFLARQIDAATLTLRLHGVAERPAGRQGSSTGRGAVTPQVHAAASAALTAAEMVLRTFNNLEERLHHSTALYVLLSPIRFASIAAYLAPPGCLLLAALAQVGWSHWLGVYCTGMCELLSGVSRRHCLVWIPTARAPRRHFTTKAATIGLLPPFMQLFAASREAKGAPVSAWRTAWRRLAAAHAIGWAASAVAAWLAGQLASAGSSGASLAWLAGSGEVSALALPVGWQLLAAGGAGLAAAAGLPAMMAALSLEDGGGGSGGSSTKPASGAAAAEPSRQQAQLCSIAAGLAAVVLQAVHWLMGRWVRCFVILLGVLPMYGLAARQPPSRLSRTVALAAVGALSGAAVAGHVPAWLCGSLLPHVVMVALAVL